jgi:hypothetical protein
MIKEGLVTLEKVTVFAYRHNPERMIEKTETTMRSRGPDRCPRE